MQATACPRASGRCKVPTPSLRSQMAAVHAALGQPEPFQLLYAWAAPAPAPAGGADPPAPPSAARPDPASGSARAGVADPIRNPSMGPGSAGLPAPSSGDRAEAGLARGLGRGPGSGAACGVQASQADQGLGLGSGFVAGPEEHAGAPGGSPPQMSLLQPWAATAVAGGGCRRGGGGVAMSDAAEPGSGTEPGAWGTGQAAELGAGAGAAASGAGGEALGCSGLTNLPDFELELHLGLSCLNPVKPFGSQLCAIGGAADPASALERAQPCGGTALAARPATAEPMGLAGALAPAGRRVLAEAGARRGNPGAESGLGSGSGTARRTPRGQENQAPAATGGGAQSAARALTESGPWQDVEGVQSAQRAAQATGVSPPVAGRVAASAAAGMRQGVSGAPAAPDATSSPARPACGDAQGHAKPAVAASHAAAAASREAVAGLPSAPCSPCYGLASLFGGGGSPAGWACSPPGWNMGLGLHSPDLGTLPVHTLAAEQLATTAARGLAYPEPDPDPQAPAAACARSPPGGVVPGDVSDEAPQARGKPGGPAGRAKRCRQRALEAPQAGSAHPDPGALGAPAADKKKKKRKGAPAVPAAPRAPVARAEGQPAARGAASIGSGGDGGVTAGSYGPASCPRPKGVLQCGLAAAQAGTSAGPVLGSGSGSGFRGSSASPAALDALRERAAAAAAAAEAAAREYAEALAGGACAKSSPEAGLGPCQGLATADVSLCAWAPRGKAAGAPGAAPNLAPVAAAASSEAGDEAGAGVHPRAHPKTRHGARKRTCCADGGALVACRATDPTNPDGAPVRGQPVADGAPAADPAGFQAGLQASGKRPCGPALQLHRLFDDMPEAAAVLGSLPAGGGSGGGTHGADAVGEVRHGHVCKLTELQISGVAHLARWAWDDAYPASRYVLCRL